MTPLCPVGVVVPVLVHGDPGADSGERESQFALHFSSPTFSVRPFRLALSHEPLEVFSHQAPESDETMAVGCCAFTL